MAMAAYWNIIRVRPFQHGKPVDILFENTSCAVNSFDTNIRYLGTGERFEPNEFEEDVFKATAVERYKNRLYVTHSEHHGKNYIDVYDLETKQKIQRIDQITDINGNTISFLQNE